VEFDHAISYVTTIKRRFQNEPQIYKAFLEILHTYQKEQRGIKDVLEQVSALFADHPDLLKEFTYFLPDAVQEQAKERLNRAAHESEMRKAAKLAEQLAQTQRAQADMANKRQMEQQHQARMDAVARSKGHPMMGGRLAPGNGIPSPVASDGRVMQGGPLGPGQMGRGPGGYRQPGMPADMLSSRGPVGEPGGPGPSRVSGFPPRPSSPASGMAGSGPSAERGHGHSGPYSGQQGGSGGSVGGYGTLGTEESSKAHTKKGIGRSQPRKQQSGDRTGDLLPAERYLSDLRTGGSYHSVPQNQATAERIFFERCRETLLKGYRSASSDGRASPSVDGQESWAEFLKCLELYSQEVISQAEMLHLVQDLLGKNTELFADFKALLSLKGATESLGSDLWYSMPLSEIDFSQCRRCTPSYRALPKDYLRPPSSERSLAEYEVLNDVWVSVPVGSEDNYSFKHLRKNQYEEALFKCEDERFEVDMVIDSNSSTIAILEPLAQEIQNLKAAETKGGQKFQYKLDKRSLGVIHLNAIIRIYGDHGAEILELLKKNPAGAIPIILKRLKQKDLEWRKARQDLNKQWKEIQEKNWHKSLDHRSFYFKQTDKKQCSQRVLVQEIREKKQNDSDEKPVTEPYFMNPHITLKFADSETHRDCFHVLAFAAEHSGLSLQDKERIMKLFSHFLQPFFCLPTEWVPQFSADSEGEVPKVSPVPTPKELPTFSSDDEESTQARGTFAKRQFDDREVHMLGEGQQLLYFTQACYFFLRLYHILFDRLKQAQELCENAKNHTETPATHPIKAMITETEGESTEDDAKQFLGDGYKSFLSLLYAVVEGTLDSSRYEDGCRSLAGNNAFMLYTLDKLTAQLLKQAMILAAEPSTDKLLSLYHYERVQEHGLAPAIYHSHVATLIGRRHEELYRMQFHPGVKDSAETASWKVEPQLMIEYLGVLYSSEPPSELIKESVKMETEDSPCPKSSCEAQPASDILIKREGSDIDSSAGSSKKMKIAEDNSSPSSTGGSSKY